MRNDISDEANAGDRHRIAKTAPAPVNNEFLSLLHNSASIWIQKNLLIKDNRRLNFRAYSALWLTAH
jgi:hypothetical protein